MIRKMVFSESLTQGSGDLGRVLLNEWRRLNVSQIEFLYCRVPECLKSIAGVAQVEDIEGGGSYIIPVCEDHCEDNISMGVAMVLASDLVSSDRFQFNANAFD